MNKKITFEDIIIVQKSIMRKTKEFDIWPSEYITKKNNFERMKYEYVTQQSKDSYLGYDEARFIFGWLFFGACGSFLNLLKLMGFIEKSFGWGIAGVISILVGVLVGPFLANRLGDDIYKSRKQKAQKRIANINIIDKKLYSLKFEECAKKKANSYFHNIVIDKTIEMIINYFSYAEIIKYRKSVDVNDDIFLNFYIRINEKKILLDSKNIWGYSKNDYELIGKEIDDYVSEHSDDQFKFEKMKNNAVERMAIAYALGESIDTVEKINSIIKDNDKFFNVSRINFFCDDCDDFSKSGEYIDGAIVYIQAWL